ncbi:solute carrier family 23 member 1-like [Nematostella vectensis]|uniref:solute carrier family 23 member 1-like n=1 Tax=Nematostella vectensis TaxID=45351 RepID=UPI00207760D6|nr:solute carrier family 23 member 1-like [Nematostella vectensis]
MDKSNTQPQNNSNTPSPSNEIQAEKRRNAFGLTYAVDENPPWYACIVLGFQHYLTMLGGTLTIPFILSGPMCFSNNPLVVAEVLSTMFFVSGITTLLQTTLGVRLPIIQGGSFSFLSPTFAILSLPQFKCPAGTVTGESNISSNATTVDSGDWRIRMREIQGAIMISSMFQIFIGFSGIVGFLLRFIGPITVAPTITLIGLSLFHVAAEHAGNHWGVAFTTVALITIFSQMLTNIEVPLPGYRFKKGFFVAHSPVFRLFPIILAIFVSWMICAIVTAAGGFPDDPKNPNFLARTDARTIVLRESKWFRFPYPGQWGTPTVSAAGVFGMLAGVLASIIESIGDYYACSRLCGAPPPPKHAVNRGIGMEGIGCLITGLWGSGNGTTSYSTNIGALGMTKVGSLRVIQFAGMILVVMGVIGKIGALFTTVPGPIVGGVFMVMFGIVAAVGISTLQFVDLNSSRNLFIIGLSLMLGFALPWYLDKHPGAIATGSREVDQIITVLLKTNMAVAGILALFLDNAIPGTPEERGINRWRSIVTQEEDESGSLASIHIYDLPFGLNRLSKLRIARFLPFLPYYTAEENIHGEKGAVETNQLVVKGEA